MGHFVSMMGYFEKVAHYSSFELQRLFPACPVFLATWLSRIVYIQDVCKGSPGELLACNGPRPRPIKVYVWLLSVIERFV